MKLHKKIAIVFTYIAICIAISGLLYLKEKQRDWEVIPEALKYAGRDNVVANVFWEAERWRDERKKEIKKSGEPFDNSLVIEAVGLFLLLGWFAYKGDKEDK